MTHALIASAWCLACIALGLPWPCFFWAPAWYCGREAAQAEYRYIEAHAGAEHQQGHRAMVVRPLPVCLDGQGAAGLAPAACGVACGIDRAGRDVVASFSGGWK